MVVGLERKGWGRGVMKGWPSGGEGVGGAESGVHTSKYDTVSDTYVSLYR